MAKRRGKRWRHSSIRGNQIYLAGPSAARVAKGLRIDFNVPVQSGDELTVEGHGLNIPVDDLSLLQLEDRDKPISDALPSGLRVRRWCASCRTAWVAHAICTRARQHPSGVQDVQIVEPHGARCFGNHRPLCDHSRTSVSLMDVVSHNQAQ